MGTRFLTLIICFCVTFSLHAENSEKTQLLANWESSLANFNYYLPDSVKEKFLNSKTKPPGAYLKTDKYTIDIDKAKFPKERINYAIGFRNQKDIFLPKEVFLVFYFNDSELLMVSETIPYIHKSGDYSFAGAIHRIGRTYEYENGKLARISCLDRDQDLSNATEIPKKEYCGEIIHLDEQENISNVVDSKNPCSYICNSRYMPYSQPGFYYTTVDQLKLRQSPSSKSDVIKSLPLDTKVQVIEDSFKAERLSPYVNGNWVKVILEDGKEGFLYGFYLRFEKEPNLNLILQKAEEWKKENGRKGK